MAHCQCNLTIDSPYDASEHRGTNSSHVCDLAIDTECLVIEDDNDKEEDDEGGIKTIPHPSQDSIPVKEQVFGSLLIQCRKLQRAMSHQRLDLSKHGQKYRLH